MHVLGGNRPACGLRLLPAFIGLLMKAILQFGILDSSGDRLQDEPMGRLACPLRGKRDSRLEFDVDTYGCHAHWNALGFRKSDCIPFVLRVV